MRWYRLILFREHELQLQPNTPIASNIGFLQRCKSSAPTTHFPGMVNATAEIPAPHSSLPRRESLVPSIHVYLFKTLTTVRTSPVLGEFSTKAQGAACTVNTVDTGRLIHLFKIIQHPGFFYITLGGSVETKYHEETLPGVRPDPVVFFALRRC